MGAIFRPTRSPSGIARFAPMRGVLGAAIPSAGRHGKALAYDSLDLPADADNVYSMVLVSAPDGTVLHDDTSVDLSVTADGSYTITATLIENGVALSPDVVTSVSVGDAVAPTWSAGATISVTNVTSSSYTATAPTASDNAAVTGYRWRINGGAWNSGQTANVTGRTPSTTDTVEFQAGDASGNWSASLSATVTLAVAPDTTAPTWASSTLTESSVTSTGCVVSWPVATDAVGPVSYRWRVGSGAWTTTASTSATVNGQTAGALLDFQVQAFDAVPNYSTTLSKNIQLSVPAPGPDNTPPAWAQGATVAISGLTSTGYTATAPTATDDVGVTGYRWRLNGGNWNSGQTAVVTGRTPSSTDTVEFQATDMVGNWGIGLSTVVQLAAAAPAQDTIAPVWGAGATITVSNLGLSGYTATVAAATDNVEVQSYVWRINNVVQVGATGTTLNASGRTAGTTDVVDVRAVDAANNYSEPLTRSIALLNGGNLATNGERMVVPAGNVAKGPLGSFKQQPEEKLDYAIDYGVWFAARNDAFDAFEVVVPPGLTLSGVNRVGDVIYLFLEGGVDSERYTITVRVTTTTGAIKEAEFRVTVRDFT